MNPAIYHAQEHVFRRSDTKVAVPPGRICSRKARGIDGAIWEVVNPSIATMALIDEALSQDIQWATLLHA
jgi:hypothetical protein